MAFKVEVVADSSGKFCSNAIRLATEEEALAYGLDLALRWTLVVDMRVVPCNDVVNYQWVDGALRDVSTNAKKGGNS